MTSNRKILMAGEALMDGLRIVSISVKKREKYPKHAWKRGKLKAAFKKGNTASDQIIDL